MTKLFIFGFKNTVCESLVKSLDGYLIDSSQVGIDQLIELLETQRPNYILGIGQYLGRDKDRVRLELSCTNKFRNHLIGSTLQRIELANFINNPLFKLSTRMGNSWCNLVSFKVMKLLNSWNGEYKYSFLHIPKNFDQQLARLQLLQSLGTLQIECQELLPKV